MLDLSLDDDDDLLELEGTKPVVKLMPLTPPLAARLERCEAFARDVAAGRVKDVDYKGTCPDLQLWTYIELFQHWWEAYQRKPNPVKLDCAFLAAAKCRAGDSWYKVQSPLLKGWTGRVEVVDALPTLVKLLIWLPFDCHRIRPNVENSLHWRAVWFNKATKLPVIPTEPFRIL